MDVYWNSQMVNVENDHTAGRWSGVKDAYDKFRAQPPEGLISLLAQISKKKIPDVILDLGCGTGLSTRPWARFAGTVIGIDPSEEMLGLARTKDHFSNIRYELGTGSRINMPDGSVDIITSAHSIHWMEPESTIVEIMRVLKRDGMFVMYGHNFPPLSMHLEIDSAYFGFKKKCEELALKLGLNEGFYKNMVDFSAHLYAGGGFEHFREFYFHEEKKWTAADYIGWLHTHGVVQKLLQRRINEDEFDLPALERKIQQFLGDVPADMILTWRVIVFKNPNF